MSGPTTDWYYTSIDGTEHGPVSLQAVQDYAHSETGDLSQSYAFHADVVEDWAPLMSFQVLAKVVSTPVPQQAAAAASASASAIYQQPSSTYQHHTLVKLNTADQKHKHTVGARRARVSLPIEDTSAADIKVAPYHGSRDGAIRTLVSDESEYHNALTALSQQYLVPIRAAVHARTADGKSAAILSDKDIECVFRGIDTIVEIQNQVHDMINAQTTTNYNALGKELLSLVPFLKAYSDFVPGHDAAMLRLEKLHLGEEKYRNFLEQAKTKTDGVGLGPLLQQPLEYVAKMHQQVHNIAQSTSSTHNDYQNLQNCAKQLDNVLQHQEVALAQARNRQLIADIEARFIVSPKFMVPGRKFLSQGILTKQCRKSDKKMYFFLFNDALAYATEIGWKLSLNRTIPIDSSFFIEDIPDPTNVRHMFRVNSAQKSFLVYAASASAKENWMRDITACMEYQQKHLGFAAPVHASSANGISVGAPVYQPDSAIKNCPLCDREFTLLQRRHHCRACGRVVCDECSKHRLVLDRPGRQGQTKGKQRVCNECETMINKGVKPRAVSNDLVQALSPMTSPRRATREMEAKRGTNAAALSGANITSTNSSPIARATFKNLVFECVDTSMMVHPSTKKEFMAYYIHIVGYNIDHTVALRYSQVDEFDKSFRKLYPSIPYRIPPTKLFGSTSPAVIEERRCGFVAYFAGIATVRALWDPLGNFLGIDKNAWTETERQIGLIGHSPAAADTKSAGAAVPVLPNQRRAPTKPQSQARPRGTGHMAVNGGPPPPTPPRTYKKSPTTGPGSSSTAPSPPHPSIGHHAASSGNSSVSNSSVRGGTVAQRMAALMNQNK
jgi:FYVE zinc finger/RhoGEF domain/PH domain/PX domain